MRAERQDFDLKALDQYQPYLRLERQTKLIRKYFYLAALAPFAVVLFVVLQYFPNSRSNAVDAFVLISLAWGIGLAIYSLAVIGRWLLIRCPRCKWRFGGSDQCRSCGLPRHSSTEHALP